MPKPDEECYDVHPGIKPYNVHTSDQPYTSVKPYDVQTSDKPYDLVTGEMFCCAYR